MAWTIRFDQAAQATLDRLTSAISLHTQTTFRIGKDLMAEIEDLEAAVKAVADANINLASTLSAAVAEFPELSARIAELSAQVADLTAQLAAAVANGDSTRIAAVSAQLTPLADQINQEAASLKTAADAAASALPQPAPAPEQEPTPEPAPAE